VRIKIRAERRGFLNASTASTFVLAGLLWMFERNASIVTYSANVSPGAAVLLIAPALMAIFVTRPTESTLVSAALTGVRTADGAAAAASVLAAAALAGARETEHAHATLAACAGVATVSWCSITIAWLGTFHFVRKHANRARGFWCGEPATRRRWSLAAATFACFGLAAWGTAVFTRALGADRHPQRDLVLLAVDGLVGLGVWLPRRKGRAPMGMVLVTGAAMIGALALAGLMLIHGVARPIPSTIRTLAVVIGGFLFVVAGAATVSAELAPIESSSTAPR
jgi:hypothetical protein